MKRNHYPNHVQLKLDKYAQQVAHWTAQVGKTQNAIDSARERLTGGFQKDSEYKDLRASLDRLVEKDFPTAERKLDDAQHTLSECKSFLAALPDDAVLEPVAPVKPNGIDLASVRRRIADVEAEVARIAAVSVPSADLDSRVREYVAALARPKVSGIATGQSLQVIWPDDVISVLALLLPDEMVNALLREVERVSNLPMPLPQRKRRIAELRREIDEHKRQALALGEDASSLPPEVVLGVRVAARGAAAAA